jgi:hypothetical protein
VFILYVKNTQPTSLYDVHRSQLAFERNFNSTSSRTGKRDFLKIKSGTNVKLEEQNATRTQFVSWLHYRKRHLFLRIKRTCGTRTGLYYISAYSIIIHSV